MLKFSKIVGLTVLALKEGRVMGHVHDVLVNLQHKYIESICILNTLERKQYLKLVDINLADNKITISNKDIIKNLDNRIQTNKELLSSKRILNKKVFTNKGDDVGRINDIYFDLDAGTLEAFEISDGIIQDILSGRRIIPAIGDISLKEEGIFISKDAFEEIIESGKGLENIFFNT